MGLQYAVMANRLQILQRLCSEMFRRRYHTWASAAYSITVASVV